MPYIADDIWLQKKKKRVGKKWKNISHDCLFHPNYSAVGTMGYYAGPN